MSDLTLDDDVVMALRLPIGVRQLHAVNQLCEVLYGPGLRVSGIPGWMLLHTPTGVADPAVGG